MLNGRFFNYRRIQIFRTSKRYATSSSRDCQVSESIADPILCTNIPTQSHHLGALLASGVPVDLFTGWPLSQTSLFNMRKRKMGFQSNLWFVERDMKLFLRNQVMPTELPPLRSLSEGLAVLEGNSFEPQLYFNIDHTNCAPTLKDYLTNKMPLCCAVGRRFSLFNQVRLISHAKDFSVKHRCWISRKALGTLFDGQVKIEKGASPIVLKLREKEALNNACDGVERKNLQAREVQHLAARNVSEFPVQFFSAEQTTNPSLLMRRAEKPFMKDFSTGKNFPYVLQHLLFSFAEEKGFKSSLWIDSESIDALAAAARRTEMMIRPKQTVIRVRTEDLPKPKKYYNVDQLVYQNIVYAAYRKKFVTRQSGSANHTKK